MIKNYLSIFMQIRIKSHNHLKIASEITSKLSVFNSYQNSRNYTTEQRGCLFDPSYRMYLKDDKNNIISPFHDIPLHSEKDYIYNMIVEVPRWSNAKMEISTKEKMNPIRQDEKNGVLRFVANCFPHHGYLWNYGCLPQTWEDPSYIDTETNAKGDADPIDVCEIGCRIHSTGTVIKVKLLGILCLIDEEETDWKIIAIDVNDPLASKIHSIEDVEKNMPGLLNATVNWYKIYKTPFGSQPNKFAFDEKTQDAIFAREIVNNVHQHWKNLMHNKVDKGIDIEKSCAIYDCPWKITQSEAVKTVKYHSEKRDAKNYHSDVNIWHYIK